MYMALSMELFTRIAASACIMVGTCIATDVAARHMHGSMGRGIAAILDTGLHGLLGAATWMCVELLGMRLPLSRGSTPAPRSLLCMPSSPDAWSGTPWSRLSLALDVLRQRAGLEVPHMDALLCVAACGAAASLLDVDHFLAAASLRLNDAMTLSTRPFGHAVLFVVTSVAIVRAVLPSSDAWLLLAVAWGSHHLRDSIKRGLWLAPFGSTPRVPYPLYCALMAALPVLVHLMLVSSARGQLAAALGSAHVSGTKEDVSV